MSPLLQLLAVLLASALLPAHASAHLNDTIYMVTISSRVTAGAQEPLCVHVLGPSEPLRLSVTLEVKQEKTPLLEELVSQDFHRCLTFQVPVVSRNTVATVQLDIAGERDAVTKQSRVLILPPAFIHLVQTDKPIYKPGQTVKFRIVSMDTAFIPVSRVYQDVALMDPNSNRIAQWLDKAVDAAGILDLSHPVIPEAVQGVYSITATTERGEQISHTFEIKEYVLPKYEVKVQLPSVISILDAEATFSVCGKYTYGKPVIGSVEVAFCRGGTRFFWYSHSRVKDICRNYELQTDKSGCIRQTVNLTDFALDNDMYADTFTVTAKMEEYGTGVVLKGNGRTGFTSDVQTVTFEDVSESYKPGIPFQGKVKVVGPDNKAVAEQSVYLSAGQEQKVTLVTDSKGLASFSLDTSAWKNTVHLRAKSRNSPDNDQYVPHLRRPEYRMAHHNVEEFYSKSSSFLKLKQISHRFSCDKDAAVQAQYIIQGNELKTGQEVLDIFYLVLSKGTIVQHGQVPVPVTAGSVNRGELSFPLAQLTKVAPMAQVVVYTVMPSGEGVADSQNFPIQACLNNKVSLKFSSLQELPAEKTTVSLQARPGSLCSVRAIDQSVLLLKKEQELTVDHVFSQLPIQSVSGYPSEVSDFEPYPCWSFPPVPLPELEPNARAKRTVLPFEPVGRKHDVFSIFEEVGVKLITNSDVKKPSECFKYGIFAEYDDATVLRAEAVPDGGRVEKTKKTLRTYFPETWIWELVSVGDDGSVSLERTVPDTITKWAAGAFCVSPDGFGVAPNTGLTVFQPFFVSLTLPYSVIRGEVFTLKATVFNYLSKCIMVDVTLANSDQFTFRNCDGCLYTICLCAEESRTFSWIVTPTALGKVDVKVSAEAMKTDSLCGNEVATVPDVGRVDTVIRNLLVEAEGTPQMVSHNALLCPADGPVEKKISLLMPELFVEGSARAAVSVVGDLMGRAMKNLDRLLAMPYGCGEQNMLLFAPNIFILNYLQSTQQLTKSILDKAVRFLESGYQRELTYKHSDGSYSAFGKSDASGNTWLTAFVMKSFGGAEPFIFVDPKHVQQARAWLYSHQRPDGCIQSVGKLFHNEMKGGVSDDVSLTAYITAAFLELDRNATDPVVQNCLRCLKTAAAAHIDNVYTSALLSYTFTLAGDEDMRTKLITLLHHKSTIEASGGRHWERAGASRKKLDSLEVEITSYVLLALLSGPPMADFGLDYSSGIVRWLTQQQNPYGGFSSTQDTVVALQALAKYGAATYSADGATTVTVTSLGGLSKEFSVHQKNRLLYQEENLSEIPGEYSIRAQGQSCVLAQISGHYNVPPPADFSAFNVSVSAVPQCVPGRSRLELLVSVRYQGRRDETNMVIINVKLLSGYVVDKAALAALQSDHTVKRVETDDGYVNIYLDGLKKDETSSYPVTLQEDQPVRNLKPAVVKVYDYYQTSDEAVTEYTTTCAESDNVNEL